MFKKIFILSLVLFTSYSCSDTQVSGLILKEQADFSLFVPSNWATMSGASLEKLPVPALGEISFVSSSIDVVDGFSNNLVVLSQKLPSQISSYDYSVLNNPSLKKDFSYFKSISEKDITFAGDSTNSKLYIYEAKYSKQTPSLNFLQSGVVCGDKGYLITIGLSKNNSSFTKYENMLKTFSCK